ncbi:MAG TPA: hypothetical protein DCL31_06485 [Clostridium sp.]|nr:hypothetical protein [Clostridium sp.]
MKEKNKCKIIFTVIACIVFGGALFLKRPINETSFIISAIIAIGFIIGIITKDNMNLKKKHIIFLLLIILLIALVTVLSNKEIIPDWFFVPFILTIVGLSIIPALYRTIKNLMLYYKDDEDE